MRSDAYEVRLALASDEPALVRFIDEEWRRRHVLVTCKPLLDWQHRDAERGTYNFVLGVERRTQAVHGVLGFIPLSQFDPEIPRERLCWTAIWKTAEGARGHRLGRRLLAYLEETVKAEALVAISPSAMSVPMYVERGYQVGRLSHHFLLHPDLSEYQLAVGETPMRLPGDGAARTEGRRLVEATEGDLRAGADACALEQREQPRKTAAYLVNRYLRHPIYVYQAYTIVGGGGVEGIVVTRICTHGGARAIRIVDFVGPSRALRGLEPEWTRLLREHHAEYVDFYSVGVADDDLAASGFTLRREGDGIVIPSHFEPFARRNVEMDYTIRIPAGTAYRIVKGDSDQDRPSVIPQGPA